LGISKIQSILGSIEGCQDLLNIWGSQDLMVGIRIDLETWEILDFGSQDFGSQDLCNWGSGDLWTWESQDLCNWGSGDLGIWRSLDLGISGFRISGFFWIFKYQQLGISGSGDLLRISLYLKI
jgi:hypothetical protein